jgi:hypothetical protein
MCTTPTPALLPRPPKPLGLERRDATTRSLLNFQFDRTANPSLNRRLQVILDCVSYHTLSIFISIVRSIKAIKPWATGIRHEVNDSFLCVFITGRSTFPVKPSSPIQP